MNSVSSKNAIAVRTSSSGVGATARRSAVRHRSVISSRSRRRTSRSSAGVEARVVEPLEQPRSAAQGDEHRPPAGLGRVGGEDQA